ncbi:MAG: hypothetical protein RLZZ314_1666 [Bacteroidota bacterium]|jgi:drug/metabolite transporter (DMT)-like permease|nr:DMT family transporter [Bacteroidota bacterium]
MGTSNAAMWLALIILGFVWGSSFILMKLALFDTSGAPLVPAFDVAMWRIALAGLALSPFAFRHRAHLVRQNVPWLLVVGCFGNLIPAYLFTTAQTLIPSSLAGMLNALTPMFTLLVAVLLFGTQVKGAQVGGVVIGLLGAAILAFQPGSGVALGDGTMEGSLRVLTATACYGVSVNVIRNKLADVPPAAVASMALGLVSIPALALASTGSGLGQVLTHPDGLRAVAAVTVLAVVGTGLALIAFNRIIQRTNAIFASTVTYIIPVFATLWGWLDNEPITSIHLVGGVVVLAGVWLVNRASRRPAVGRG